MPDAIPGTGCVNGRQISRCGYGRLALGLPHAQTHPVAMRPFPAFRLRSLLATLLLAFAVAAPIAAQPGIDSSQVTLEQLYSLRYFSGEGVGSVRWLDGSHTTSLEPSTDGEGRDLVRIDAATGEQEILVPASQFIPEGASEPLSVENYAWSDDGRKLLLFTNSRRVWRINSRGDYWVLDLDGGAPRQLGGDAPEATLMFATFSPQSDRVAYVSEHNIFVEDIATSAITPLTTDGSETIINGTFDWVYEEEFGLRNGFRWSPDGEHIAYWRLDANGIRDFLLLNNTDSLYSFTIPIQYPKAGTMNSEAKIGVVSASGGPTRWFRLSDDERNHYPARMDWAASSDALIIQHLDRLQQRNEVLLADTRRMEASPIFIETDDAWTDAIDDLVWFDDGQQFTWLSDRDGWQRLYIVGRDGSAMRPVTPPGQDVLSILQIDTEGGWVYYRGAPEGGPNMQRVLYRTRLNGEGSAERLTPTNQPGTHSYILSPGAQYAVHRWSRFGDPSRAELISLPDHQPVRTLAANDALRSKIESLDRGRAFFTTLPAEDGTPLDAWVMLPPDFDETSKYPVLMYVYGEPAGTTVTDRWGGSGYLWHLMLTQHGYIVASVDPRGTPSPRGRDWRKMVYGEIGVQSSADFAAGARSLATQYPWVDASRIGIWGWSGGGSSTLNSLFRYPEVFAMGMSVAPVPDQRLYDTIYQERYMGLPQSNAAGYDAGSPITYADGLEDHLLIVHGTGDDNVHFQGTERLINRLIELNKPFTMMAYPNRSHGIFEGSGTTRHLRELLTRYLYEHLPQPVPTLSSPGLPQLAGRGHPEHGQWRRPPGDRRVCGRSGLGAWAAEH